MTPETLQGPAAWIPAATQEDLLIQAKAAAINHGLDTAGEDIIGLRAMMIYGLKGVAAYAYHAHALSYDDEEVFTRIGKSPGFSG